MSYIGDDRLGAGDQLAQGDQPNLGDQPDRGDQPVAPTQRSTFNLQPSIAIQPSAFRLQPLATVLLAGTALFEQGVNALGALLPPVNPIVFSLAWIAEAAIVWLLATALGERQCA